MAKGIMYVDNIRVEFDDEPTRRTPISYAVFCLKKKNLYDL